MINNVQFEGLTIYEVCCINFYSRINYRLLVSLEEMKSINLQNTEDTVNVEGKGGQILYVLDRNKSVTGSGVSGYMSGGLASLQTGTPSTSGEIKFRKYQTFSVSAGTTTINLAKSASGTEGSEILSFIATVDGVATEYSQATNADTTHFSYTNKVITIPTEITGDADIEVVYDYLENGTEIKNSGDTHGETVHATIDCLARNSCDEVYFVQFDIPRCKLSANFSWDMGAEGVEHPFEFVAQKNNCKTSTEADKGIFWSAKVCKNAA